MAPPFGPFAGAGRRRRGPPPFVIQMMRAPLTINNIVALGLSIHTITNDRSFYRSDSSLAAPFKFLIALFSMSLAHNFLSMLRFHKIRREVFAGDRCATCNSWKKQGRITLESDEARMERFKEMGRRMPSLKIAGIDLVLAAAFFAAFVWSTCAANSIYRISLEIAYTTFGALIAFVFNFLVGMGGLKFWYHSRKTQDVKLPTAMSDEYLDATESLLPAPEVKQESDNKGKQIEI